MTLPWAGSYIQVESGSFDILAGGGYENGTQGFIACSLGRVSADTPITITNGNGNTVILCTTKYDTALLIISSPDIIKGRTYTVTAGTVSGDVQAS